MLVKEYNNLSNNKNALRQKKDGVLCCGDLIGVLCSYTTTIKPYNNLSSPSPLVTEISGISIDGEDYAGFGTIGVTTNAGRKQFIEELEKILIAKGYAPKGEVGFVMEKNGDFSLITGLTDLTFNNITTDAGTLDFDEKCQNDNAGFCPKVMYFTEDNPDTEIILPGSIEYFERFLKGLQQCGSKYFMAPIVGDISIGGGYGTSVSYDYEKGGPLDLEFNFDMDLLPFDGNYTDEKHIVRLVKDHPTDPDGSYYNGVQSGFGPILGDNGKIITFGIEISYLADVAFKLKEINYKITIPKV